MHITKEVFALNDIDEGERIHPQAGCISEAVQRLGLFANLPHTIKFPAPKTPAAYINKCSPALSPPKIT